MKYILVLALCLVSITVVLSCSSADDCEEDECCVRTMLMGSSCKKHQQENERCVEDTKETKTNKEWYFCDCRSDLSCIAQKEFSIFGKKIKLDYRCVKPEEPATSEPATSESKPSEE